MDKTEQELIREALEAKELLAQAEALRKASLDRRRLVVKAMAKEGFTYREIGDLIGVWPQRVQTILSENAPPSHDRRKAKEAREAAVAAELARRRGPVEL